MNDLAELLSTLSEFPWVVGADLDYVPVQARELVPNLKVDSPACSHIIYLVLTFFSLQYYAEDLKAYKCVHRGL